MNTEISNYDSCFQNPFLLSFYVYIQSDLGQKLIVCSGSCAITDNEEEEEENDMETEDRDSEDSEKPNITFDPSLPTSHAVGDALALCIYLFIYQQM